MFLIELLILGALGGFIRYKEPPGSDDEKAVEQYQENLPQIDKFNVDQPEKSAPVAGAY